jgi:hypothetical protein
MMGVNLQMEYNRQVKQTVHIISITLQTQSDMLPLPVHSNANPCPSYTYYHVPPDVKTNSWYQGIGIDPNSYKPQFHQNETLE